MIGPAPWSGSHRELERDWPNRSLSRPGRSKQRVEARAT